MDGKCRFQLKASMDAGKMDVTTMIKLATSSMGINPSGVSCSVAILHVAGNSASYCRTTSSMVEICAYHTFAAKFLQCSFGQIGFLGQHRDKC